MQAGTHHTRPFVASEIMPRDVVSVSPEAPVGKAASTFRYHRSASLPVVGEHGDYLGIVFQMHLMALIGRNALAGPDLAHEARHMMSSTEPTAPIGALRITLAALPAQEGRYALLILHNSSIAGTVTLTDTLTALPRSLAIEDIGAST